MVNPIWRDRLNLFFFFLFSFPSFTALIASISFGRFLTSSKCRGIDVGVIVLPKACCVNWAGGPRVTGDRGLLAGNVYTLSIRVITSPLRAIKQPSLSLCTNSLVQQLTWVNDRLPFVNLILSFFSFFPILFFLSFFLSLIVLGTIDLSALSSSIITFSNLYFFEYY